MDEVTTTDDDDDQHTHKIHKHTSIHSFALVHLERSTRCNDGVFALGTMVDDDDDDGVGCRVFDAERKKRRKNCANYHHEVQYNYTMEKICWVYPWKIYIFFSRENIKLH